MSPPGGLRALIVTTARARGSLAAVRALSAAGWHVGVGLPESRGMVTASRWCEQRHLIPRPRGDVEPFVSAVAATVTAGRYDIVFGGGDDTLAALAVHRDRIPACVAHPPSDRIALALDKVELAHRAADAGLRAPRTEVVTDDVLERWRGPLVVKCRSHWTAGEHPAYRIETRRYDEAGHAVERVRRIRAAGFVPVVQEVVDGGLGALVGLMDGGRLIGRIQQETSALWPVPSGVSSRAVTVAVDVDLADRCELLLRRLGWSGLVELQFLTPQGGEPQLIDLNGRFYGSMALANAAGPNLADAWARQALGHRIPRLDDGRAGVRFSWLAGDLRRAVAERRGGLVGDVAATLNWARCAEASSVWDRHDIHPAAHVLLGAALARVAPPRAHRSP